MNSQLSWCWGQLFTHHRDGGRRLRTLLFAVRRRWVGLVLWLNDAHVIGQRALRANLARRIPRQHDLDTDAKYT